MEDEQRDELWNEVFISRDLSCVPPETTLYFFLHDVVGLDHKALLNVDVLHTEAFLMFMLKSPLFSPAFVRNALSKLQNKGILPAWKLSFCPMSVEKLQILQTFCDNRGGHTIDELLHLFHMWGTPLNNARLFLLQRKKVDLRKNPDMWISYLDEPHFYAILTDEEVKMIIEMHGNVVYHETELPLPTLQRIEDLTAYGKNTLSASHHRNLYLLSPVVRADKQ